MKKALPLLLFLSITITALAAQQQKKRDHSADLDSLVNTERAFARAASEKGTREAFLAFIADDGLLFRPKPVNGKQFLQGQQNRDGLLSWEPVYADISAAGDLGYTTGPWEFRRKGKDDKPVAFGNFMTIWKRQTDGTFKFMIDLGISNEQPASGQTLQFSTVKSKTAKNASVSEVEAGRNGILSIEREFSKAVSEGGTLKGYLAYVADDVRLLREGKFPFVGKQAARTLLESGAGKLSWQPAKADVAQSVDLGYTYGTYEWRSADGLQDEDGNYVHIWKRQPDGKWKVVMEVLNPIPKKPS